jgi:predicted Zn-dependent protease
VIKVFSVKRKVAPLLIAIALVSVCAPSNMQKKAETFPPEATPEEIELGKQASSALEAKEKLVNDPELLNKINNIAQKLGSVTERPKIKYTVKVIERQVPNAFTFPGGFIYLTKGLIDITDSEHEIAAVLAHEIAHNVLRHALKAMEAERKWTPAIIAAIVGSVASSGEIARQLPLFVGSLIESVMLGYSRKFEQEADVYGLNYLIKAGFNPVGMLTVFEKLERIETLSYGGQTIWQAYTSTHPGLSDRISWVKERLNQLGIPIVRRTVVAGGKATAEEEKIGDTTVGVVKVRTTVFCKLATVGENSTGFSRAKEVAEKLNKLLDAGLKRYEVRLWKDDSKVAIKARDDILVEVTDEDAKLHNLTKLQLAEKWLNALTHIFLAEQLYGSD